MVHAGVHVVLAARRVVDVRGAVSEGLEGVEQRRQKLVGDLDELHRPGCRGLVDGGHRRHLVAHEAHLLLGQHVLVVAGRADAVEHVRHVFAGDYGLDPGQGLGRGGVDRDDPRVRVRAGEDLAVEHVGQRDVFGEHGPTGDLGRSVGARVAAADHAACPVLVVGEGVRLGVAGMVPPVLDGLDDALVAAAAAQVAPEGLLDLVDRRARVAVDERLGGHHHARGAVATLDGSASHECPLQGVQRSVPLETLHGFDLGAVDGDGQHQARLDGLAVEDDRARAAVSEVAPPLGPSEAQMLTQHLEQSVGWPRCHPVLVAVDGELDHPLHVTPPSPAPHRRRPPAPRP